MKRDNFLYLQIVFAFALLLLPLVLFFVNGMHFEKSISMHAYATPIAFATTLTFAVALLVYNGVVVSGSYSNFWSGLALLGVIIFGCQDYPILHYSFALTFFLWSFASMVIYSPNKYSKWILSVIGLVAVSMGLVLLGELTYKILLIEWIGILPISAFLIFNNLNKIQ